MTNAELIEKIRAEVERIKRSYDVYLARVTKEDILNDLDDLIYFIDTLESEKPNQDELEKEIGSYMSNKWKFGCVIPITPVILPNFTTEDLKECARHFAQWGAEHAKIESEKPVPNDLEEAAEKSLRLAGFHNMETRGMDWKGGFIAGAKWQENKDQETIKLAEDHAFLAGADWQREQMLKEAEECELYWDGDSLAIDLNLAALGYSERDKVRVIIVKED